MLKCGRTLEVIVLIVPDKNKKMILTGRSATVTL